MRLDNLQGHLYKAINFNLNVSVTTDLTIKRLRIHGGQAKTDCSLATPICIEKIGLTHCLDSQRVPTVILPAYSCGWHHEMESVLLCLTNSTIWRAEKSVGSPANNSNTSSHRHLWVSWWFEEHERSTTCILSDRAHSRLEAEQSFGRRVSQSARWGIANQP